MEMKYFFPRFPGGKGKAVTLSYDDGCPEDIRFSDTISKYGLKCTFNLNGERGSEARKKEVIRMGTSCSASCSAVGWLFCDK